jgi:hypothetical protein
MSRRSEACAAVLILFVVAALGAAAQSVYPTSTTLYDPDGAWNGFTVLSPIDTQAAIVIDMNGRIVKQWIGYVHAAGGPARVLPNGVVIAAVGANPPHQESVELIQRDFQGRVLWRFGRYEQIETPEGALVWSARQHHDWQREDFPAGYYAPGVWPAEGGKTLILTHTNHNQPKVADVPLEDDRLIEIAGNGDIVWEWIAGNHIEEFGFSAAARAAIGAAPAVHSARGSFDWLHLNAAAYVGPNRWFDEGDSRFAPNNVLVSSRHAGVLAIVARDGKIVWRLGPDFSASKELRAIRQIVGQHNAHIVPKGLPGAGNLLVFDNGGASGYGAPNATAPDGANVFGRAGSRVLEINPVTLELVWSYAAPRFFSTNISGAQRLPNGNTLITEGANGRVFEVTNEGRIVWEYIYPLFTGTPPANAVYRGYRLPYDWIPQIEPPKERAVTPPPLGSFRTP